MTETNQILFNRRREEVVYAVKCHSDFLIGKVESINKALASNKNGAHYALLTEQLIAASSSIPLIVKELGRLREEYAALSN
jgi:hypothetical protein